MTEPELTYWTWWAEFDDGSRARATCRSIPLVTEEMIHTEQMDTLLHRNPQMRERTCVTWQATLVTVDEYRTAEAELLHMSVHGPRQQRWPFSARLGVPALLLGSVFAVLGGFLPGAAWMVWGTLLFPLGVMALVYATRLYGRWWEAA